MTVIYTKNDCQPCRLTKEFFKRKGIEFIEYNVEEQPEAMNFVTGMGYQSVPVVVVDHSVPAMTGAHWNGLRPDKLNELANAVSSVG